MIAEIGFPPVPGTLPPAPPRKARPAVREIPFAWHWYGPGEAEAATIAVRGRVIDGPETEAYEREFAARVGAKHAIATSSCTAALEACCHAVGVEGREVVTTPLSFTATANAPRRAGARVRFADVVRNGYHVDPLLMFRAMNANTAAVIPMHYAGIPCDIETIESSAWSRGAVVIEDAAMALGGTYADGTPIGSRPETLCCFSTGPEKPITTGVGGMVTTGNDELAAKVRRIVRQGIEKHGPTRDQVLPGMNGRITEIQAAIGRVQLARLEGFIAERKRIAALYVELLSPDSPPQPGNGSLFPVRLRKRNAVAAALAEAGIGSAVHYRPIHLHSAWAFAGYKRGSFPHAEIAGSWELSLPCFPGLCDEDVERIAGIVKKVGA